MTTIDIAMVAQHLRCAVLKAALTGVRYLKEESQADAHKTIFKMIEVQGTTR